MASRRQQQTINPPDGASDFFKSRPTKTAKHSSPPEDIESESPCTKKDINELKALLLGFKEEIHNEIRNSLTDVKSDIATLDNRVQVLEQAQDSVYESTSNMETLIQDLQTQLRDLQDAHEDLENRTRRNNLRFRDIPEPVHLDTFLPKFFKALLPGVDDKYLLLDRAHRALRARPHPNMPPRDVIVRFHYFQTKEAILTASRTAQLELDGVFPKIYADLASSTLQKRKDLKPLTEVLRQKGIPYRWGFPFKLTYQRNGLTYTVKHPNEIEEALPYLQDPPMESSETEQQDPKAQAYHHCDVLLPQRSPRMAARVPPDPRSFDLKVGSHNVNGLNVPQKRTVAFSDYFKLKLDVLLLQETHFSKTSSPKYLSKYYPQIYLANSTTKTKGVAILIAKQVKFQLMQKYVDPDGRFIILKGHLQNHLTTLASVYAPNNSKQKFFRIFFKKLSEISEGRVIVGGDFNTTMNNNLDRSRDILGKLTTSSGDRDTGHLFNHLKEEALVDIWREKHPIDRDYTYYSSVHATYSRIDFIFTKPPLLHYIHTVKIHDITWSDHGMVEALFKSWDKIRGGGSWRLNDSLLLDGDICMEITNSIKEFFHNNTPADTSLAIRWDAHKAERIQQLSQKLHDVATAHKKLPTPEKYREIQELRASLIQVLSESAAYTLRRTKYHFYEYANKPHTMLARKLRALHTTQTIHAIRTHKGTVTRDTTQILNMFSNFYSELYSADKAPQAHLARDSDFLSRWNPPQLTKEDQDMLAAPIAKEEVENVIKLSKPNKAPFPDGYTAKYYKKFVTLLGPHLKDLFQSLLDGSPLTNICNLRPSQ
ncbi:hypothetical protein XELAEV_18020146mg [Xenopus laevis]|uniref:Endonuclease/exonuclease/phosphatase domain-containing protein n=1 Tax=Xenopus laevis TaxID=8355 RepID=A0A974HQR4_XENLA|nr:hypothetical protein XELAEV_18020146mg [Xenopus laevis]